MKKYLRNIGIFILLSIPLVFFSNLVLNDAKDSQKTQVLNRLEGDSQLLTRIFDQNLETLENAIGRIPVPGRHENLSEIKIEDFLSLYKGVSRVCYFSTEGKMQYSYPKSEIAWNSNLLNIDWYRQMIKNWKPVFSGIHQSPFSPFPKAIAFAVPVKIKNEINGFWLIYLDTKSCLSLFPLGGFESAGKNTTWFDRNGQIATSSMNPEDQTESNANNIWHKINESAGNGEFSYVNGDDSQEFIFASNQSKLNGYKVVISNNKQKSFEKYYSLRSRVISMAILIELVILLLSNLVIRQWDQLKNQLGELQNNSEELSKLNNILSVKNLSLKENNSKQKQLTDELQKQKNDLTYLNSQLSRLNKYLDLLSLPVIVLNKNLEIQFDNYSATKMLGLPLEKVKGSNIFNHLKIKNRDLMRMKLEETRSKGKRQEFNILCEEEGKLTHHLVSSDYMAFDDWQGFIITFSDISALLELKEKLTIRNTFLNKSNKLIENFLQVDEVGSEIDKALSVIMELSNSEASLYYHLEDDKLMLRGKSILGNREYPYQLDVNDSMTGNVIKSGVPLIIRQSKTILLTLRGPEVNWGLNTGYFKPIFIGDICIGAIVIANPAIPIIEKHSLYFENFLKSFDLGLNLLSYQKELIKKNKELEKNLSFRTNLLRSITHGLNTPLSSITGYIKLFYLKFSNLIEKNSDLKNHIEKLDIAAESMDEKVKMYLDLARVNRHDLKLEEQEISLSKFIEYLFKNIEKDSRNRSLKIEKKNFILFDAFVSIDMKRLMFAIQNIFLNGMRYAPNGDKILFEVLFNNSHLILTCEDHGPLIRQQDIPYFDNEFLPESVSKERLHSSDSLAIALSVKIIEHTRGSVTIRSSEKRTIHTIEIPLKVNNGIIEKSA